MFVFYLGHPTIGLPNTISSPYRIFGWLFYFFIEGYAPLVVSVFWAFSNSITSPAAAKNNYTVMIAGSKLGGIVCATAAWFLLTHAKLSDVLNLQILLAVSSALLIIVPFIIYALIVKVPQKEMHGYEAAYKLKSRQKKHKEEETVLQSMLSGLVMLFKYPYVMGIFGMGFFYELISQALKVENIIFIKSTASSISEVTAYLIWQACLVQGVAFIGGGIWHTCTYSWLGERRSLLLIPAATGISIIGFILKPSFATAIFAFVVNRSVNYAFAAPLRESLYIPTVKNVQLNQNHGLMAWALSLQRPVLLHLICTRTALPDRFCYLFKQHSLALL